VQHPAGRRPGEAQREPAPPTGTPEAAETGGPERLAPDSLTRPASILALQGSAGNAAVSYLLRNGTGTVAPPAPGGATGDAGVAPGHLAVFEPPELLDGARPTRPDDVFSLAASFWWWATGEHPFSDGGRDEQVLAILMGERRPWPGAASLEPPLSLSLGPRVGRPSLSTVVELLAET